ncbi:MAG: outer membrane protein assembly factor BamE [Rhodospirillales bacterium]
MNGFIRISRFFAPTVILGAVILGAVILGTASCSRIDSRGNLADPDLLAGIKAGQHTRKEVAEILGSPSSISIFDKERWYYISKLTETTAFFEPEVLERKVVVLSFDEKGVLREIKTLGLEESRQIETVERETPTSGNTVGFFDQLFGNIGRFNK